MSEGAEYERRMTERRFAKRHGLVAKVARLKDDRATWARHAQNPQVTKVSGLDVGRSGTVERARERVRRQRKRLTQTPAGAGRPKRTAKSHMAAIAKSLAGKRVYRPKVRVTRQA